MSLQAPLDTSVCLHADLFLLKAVGILMSFEDITEK